MKIAGWPRHEKSLGLLVVAFLLLFKPFCRAYCISPSRPLPNTSIKHGASNHYKHSRKDYRLCMTSQFDISKPVFDLLSLRSIRGDAIVRYDSLNQSEPLRITLFGLLCVFLLIAPTFNEAVRYDPMSIPIVATSVAGAVASGGLFVRECTRRSRQLSRIEKELNTERLPIRLPTNQFAEMAFSKPVTLKELKDSSTTIGGRQLLPRLIAICGNKSMLTDALSSLAVYRQRLRQASTFVVAVSTDGSTSSYWKTLDSNLYQTWLADPYQPKDWLQFFQELSDDDNGIPSTFRWFGLTSRGQSWGSGEGEMPQWLQVLGQHLRPSDFLDVTRSSAGIAHDTNQQELLDKQQAFYLALTSGNEDSIHNIYSTIPSKEVTEVKNAGGRIDSWQDCLVEGARPSDMKVSGADVTIFSDTEAFTTVVEFPTNNGIDSTSLLAVQRWTRENNQDPWMLNLHQTIPWSPETKAQGTLRCDYRGCVALARNPDRRMFGVLVG